MVVIKIWEQGHYAKVKCKPELTVIHFAWLKMLYAQCNYGFSKTYAKNTTIVGVAVEVLKVIRSKQHLDGIV